MSLNIPTELLAFPILQFSRTNGLAIPQKMQCFPNLHGATQDKSVLASCHTFAHEDTVSVMQATITPSLLYSNYAGCQRAGVDT